MQQSVCTLLVKESFYDRKSETQSFESLIWDCLIIHIQRIWANTKDRLNKCIPTKAAVSSGRRETKTARRGVLISDFQGGREIMGHSNVSLLTSSWLRLLSETAPSSAATKVTLSLPVSWASSCFPWQNAFILAEHSEALQLLTVKYSFLVVCKKRVFVSNRPRHSQRQKDFYNSVRENPTVCVQKGLGDLFRRSDLTIATDYESALTKALRNSNANVHWRFFHFCQSIWRFVHAHGLATRYDDEKLSRVSSLLWWLWLP